jgi:CBS domain-containing protein/uncharacterized protein (DUF2267 family)
MTYDKFMGQVQHRASLASTGEAVSAVRATLQTLCHRLPEGERKHLVAQLPREIGIYLSEDCPFQRLSLEQFFRQVSQREAVDLPAAIFHARVIVEVLREAVSEGEIQDIRGLMPAEFGPLFEAESHGGMSTGAAGPATSPDQRQTKLSTNMKVREILTQNPECVSPDAALLEAAQKMKRLDVGTLPVCDGDRLVGMITDRDIAIRGTAEGRDPRQTKVRDVMTPEVIYCFDDQELSEVAKVMETRQVRRLPVVNRNKSLVGIVSLGDVAVRTQDRQFAGDILERVSEPAAMAQAV